MQSTVVFAMVRLCWGGRFAGFPHAIRRGTEIGISAKAYAETLGSQ